MGVTVSYLDEARALHSAYRSLTSESPDAIYMTLEQKDAIIAIARATISNWADASMEFNVSTFLAARVELHDDGPMCALTRDGRGLTKVIICPFCFNGMHSHVPYDLLGLNGIPSVTQYECSACYVIWPTDQAIKEGLNHAINVMKKAIKEGSI